MSGHAGSSDPGADFGNDSLRLWTSVGAVAAVVLMGAGYGLRSASDVFEPGSPLMQCVAIAGTLALLAAFAAALAKRLGRQPREGFRSHVVLSLAGVALVSFHSTASLHKPAALLLLVLVALGVLGLWARTHGAYAMSGVFGAKRAAFAGVDPARRDELRALAERKRDLLARIAPGAEEREFALRLRHWLRSPALAYRYARAVAREHELIGTRSTVAGTLAYWRLIHQLLAWTFAAGLLLHVILVLFFAAYVADGREVYWWHFTAWDIEWL